VTRLTKQQQNWQPWASRIARIITQARFQGANNLDETNGRAIMDLLFDLRDRHGATLIMVTHSADLAARCDRVVRLRDGRIDQTKAAA